MTTRAAAAALFLLALAIVPAAALAAGGDVTVPLLVDGTYLVHTADADHSPDPVVLRVSDVAPLVAAGKIADDRYDCHVWAHTVLGKGGKRAVISAESVYCYRRGGSARDTLRFKADGTVLHPDGRDGIPVRQSKRVGSHQVGVLERGSKGIFNGAVSLEVCAPPASAPVSSLPPAELRAAEPSPGR